MYVYNNALNHNVNSTVHMFSRISLDSNKGKAMTMKLVNRESIPKMNFMVKKALAFT